MEPDLPLFEKPAASVVLACRNEIDHIEACLSSILQQEEPQGGIEVLVADGMSDDGTRELLEQLRRKDPKIRVIDNPGRIVSTGLNLAIRSAKSDTIIRVDAHTEYAPDYVKRCMELLQQTGADNVGGPARTKSHKYLERAVAAAYHSPFSVGGARFHIINYEGWVDTVPYGCWRKETFQRFGYFDEQLVRDQDDEHNLRILRAGGKIWQSPTIRSWYHPRGSLRALYCQYTQYGYWKVRVIQKHKVPASWRHLVPGAFLLAMSLLLVGFVFSSLASGRWPLCSIPLLLAAGCYSLCVIAASIHAALRTEWRLLPVLPLVFPCYHFGYGYGFLRGVWDFIIRRKRHGNQFVQLTRGPLRRENPVREG